MALREELQAEFDSLDAMDMTEEQQRRVESIKTLARERGYINPSAQPNPRNEQLTSAQQPRIVGLPPGTLESGAEIAGGVVGGMLGAPLGPAGSIAGAGLGTMLTRGAVEGMKTLAGMRPPITADEALASGGSAFLEGAGGELGFRALSGLRDLKQKGMQSLLAGKLSPDDVRLYKDAQSEGIHLPLSTLTDSKAPKLIEQSLRRTLSAGGKFEARDIKNELALRSAVEKWADAALGAYPTDPVTHGKLLKSALTDRAIPEFHGMKTALYKRLDELTGDAPIVETAGVFKELSAVRASLAKRGDQYSGAVSALDDVLERISKEGPTTGLTVKKETETLTKQIPKRSRVDIKSHEVSPELQSVERGTKPYDKGFAIPGETQLEGIKTRTSFQDIPVGERMVGLKVEQKSKAEREPIRLNFRAAQDARHTLGKEIGSMRDPLPSADDRAIKKAYAMLTEAMGKGAMDYSKVTGKDINLQWLLANTMNKRGEELFNESVVAKLVTDHPEHVVPNIFKKDAYTETKDLMRALDHNPQAQNLYRRGVVEHLIQEATNQSTERVVGEEFAKAARKRGEGVLKETFGEAYPGFKRLLEVAEKMPRHDSKSGVLWYENGLYITGMSAAVTGHLVQSPAVMATAAAAPAAWFIGTKRLAEIMTNPQLTDTLLKIGKMGPRSAATARAMAQLGAVEVGETGTPMPGTSEPKRGLVGGLTEFTGGLVE
jgi:hypothetical protein